MSSVMLTVECPSLDTPAYNTEFKGNNSSRDLRLLKEHIMGSKMLTGSMLVIGPILAVIMLLIEPLGFIRSKIVIFTDAVVGEVVHI